MYAVHNRKTVVFVVIVVKLLFTNQNDSDNGLKITYIAYMVYNKFVSCSQCDILKHLNRIIKTALPLLFVVT